MPIRLTLKCPECDSSDLRLFEVRQTDPLDTTVGSICNKCKAERRLIRDEFARVEQIKDDT